jgi:hypothetical protein
MRTFTFDKTRVESSVISLLCQMPNGSVGRALSLLAESHILSQDAGCDTWHFAVGISELDGLSVSRGSLRWLLFRQFALHAYELRSTNDAVRVFSKSLGPCFQPNSSFVITPLGLSLLRRFESLSRRSAANDTELRVQFPRAPIRNADWAQSASEIPYYDRVRGELSVGEVLVRTFRRPARNQQAVLETFQELSWEARIDDPLPPVGEVAAKLRLNQTIKKLNSHQLSPLIRFIGDGSGEGVLWKFVR